MIRIDMHFHSDRSDGSETPQKLARLGKIRGLSLMSLTDHDTIEGVPDFLSACRHLGIRGLSGVEISADFPHTMHILGYAFDPCDCCFRSALMELQKRRDRRNAQVLARFNEIGIPMTISEVQREAGPGVIGRPHFAKVLIRRGIVHDMSTAFQIYLGKGGKAYVKKECLSPAEAIALIRSAGGVSVLAHPIQTTTDLVELYSILRELKSLGLWGLECYSGHHNSEQAGEYRNLALASGLECTAGSDYHGQGRPGYHMGISVPETLLPWARLGLRL